ncbi:MAG: TonB-dependent receptor [Microscillaceae bacterium]|nr:TonB-dependent receptor [Microscillaceae bacterium]
MKKLSILLYIIIYIIFFFQGSIYALNHEGSIQGQVYDAESKEPLLGVNVLIKENNQVVVSNPFGIFNIAHLAAGKYTLQISYIGYSTLEQEVEVTDSQTSFVKIALESTALRLEDITVEAGRAQNLNTINAIDIQMRPVNTSQDILRVVPGLFMAQHAGGGKAEQIFLRGFDIDHGTDIQLTADGIPVNMVSHAHGQGYSDLHFLIPELVETVAFDKGMYYADKGNFNTAGFADFRTRNVLDKSMIKLEGGQYDSFRTVALIDLLGKKAKENNQNAYIGAEYSFSNNYFDSPQNFNRLNLFAKYHHYLDQNKILSLSLSTFRSKWDASGQIPERAVSQGIIGRFGAIDDTEGGETSRSNLNVQFTQLLNPQTTIQHQIFVSKYDFELYSNFTFFLEDPENGDQIRQKEDRILYGYRGAVEHELSLGNSSLISEFGVDIRRDEVRNNELSRSFGRKTTLENLALGEVNENNLGMYLRETFYINPKFSVQGALRLDYFQFSYVNALSNTFERQTESKALLLPKLNINYDISPKVSLYLKTGIGFHSNDTRVVVAQEGREILPKAYGSDLGIVFKPYDRLLIQAAAWYLRLDQEFVYVGDAAVVEPSGETERNGIDISLRWQLTDWLFADADLNLTQAKALNTPENEDNIPLAPTFTSIGGLSFQFKNGLNGSLRYRYLDDRPANEDNSTVAEGYFLMDAVLRFTRPRYQIGFTVENLLNRDWKEAQFDTESRLFEEAEPVSEIHFTPGTPFFLRGSVSFFF